MCHLLKFLLNWGNDVIELNLFLWMSVLKCGKAPLGNLMYPDGWYGRQPGPVDSEDSGSGEGAQAQQEITRVK